MRCIRGATAKGVPVQLPDVIVSDTASASRRGHCITIDFRPAFLEGMVEVLDSPVTTTNPSVHNPPRPRGVKTEVSMTTSGSADAAAKTEEEDEDKPLVSRTVLVSKPLSDLQVATQAAKAAA